MRQPTPEEWRQWSARAVEAWEAFGRSLQPIFERVAVQAHEIRWALDAPAAYAEAIGEIDDEEEVFI